MWKECPRRSNKEPPWPGLSSPAREDTVHLIAEINRRFIHRRDYMTTVLKEGDQVELILPAFGGVRGYGKLLRSNYYLININKLE